MNILDDWYEEANFKKIYYTGLACWVSSRFHRLLEKNRTNEIDTILELGATHGQHLKFVNQKYQKYILSDLKVSEVLLRFDSMPNIEVKSVDAMEMNNIKNSTIDRIISTCLLHHLPDVNKALLETRRVLSVGGLADFLLPNDPSLLWNLGRTLITFPKAKLNGWSWKQYWQYVHTDHINEINFLRSTIIDFAKNYNMEVEIEKFPLNKLPDFLTVYFRITLVNNNAYEK